MRINFMSGPCAGKSTTAAWLFSELKTLDYSVELVSEYVKNWSYIKRTPKAWDQLYLFAKQVSKEDVPLAAGVKNIVTDSPIFLSPVYARLYSGVEGLDKALLNFAELYDKARPSISIFLDRKDKEYKIEGRWGTIDTAREIDNEVLKFLQERHKDTPERLLIGNWKRREEIVEFVKPFLD